MTERPADVDASASPPDAPPGGLDARVDAGVEDRRGPAAHRASADYRAPAGRRLFVAVPIPEPTIAAIADLVAGVQQVEDAAAGRTVAGPGGNESPGERRPPWRVRWVRFEGLHLTVRFLGPTDDPRIDEAGSAVREAAAELARETGPFRVRIAGAGAFPDAHHPRTLWLAITDGVEQLGRAAATVDAALVRAGWPAEARPFRPHLTLARSDGVRSASTVAAALLAAASTFAVTFEATRLVLYESHTGGGAARYEALHEATLGS